MGTGFRGYFKASSNESTSSPLVFQYFAKLLPRSLADRHKLCLKLAAVSRSPRTALLKSCRRQSLDGDQEREKRDVKRVLHIRIRAPGNAHNRIRPFADLCQFDLSPKGSPPRILGMTAGTPFRNSQFPTQNGI